VLSTPGEVAGKTGHCEAGKPGSKKGLQRLFLEEEVRVLQLAKYDKYADLWDRQVAVVASETEQVAHRKLSEDMRQRVKSRRGIHILF